MTRIQSCGSVLLVKLLGCRRMSGRAPLWACPIRGPRLDQRLPDVPSTASLSHFAAPRTRGLCVRPCGKRTWGKRSHDFCGQRVVRGDGAGRRLARSHPVHTFPESSMLAGAFG
jgi:hypothetical protein